MPAVRRYMLRTDLCYRERYIVGWEEDVDWARFILGAEGEAKAMEKCILWKMCKCQGRHMMPNGDCWRYYT